MDDVCARLSIPWPNYPETREACRESSAYYFGLCVFHCNWVIGYNSSASMLDKSVQQAISAILTDSVVLHKAADRPLVLKHN